MISESGLIKIPADLLKKVIDESHLIFLSFAYHKTRLDSSVQKHHNLILKMLKYYEMSPIDQHLLADSFTIVFDDSDLPEDYRKYARGKNSIVVKIDTQELKYYGYFREPSTICLCVTKLYNLLRTPSCNEHEVFDAFKSIDGTIEHEITHYIQKNYLHGANSTRLPGYEKFGHEYYNSPVEFDPTIKSDLKDFATFASKLDKNAINDAIKYFVHANYNTKFVFTFPKSTFFYSLRTKNKEKYIRAVKVFAQHAKEAVRDYKLEHLRIQETQAQRLDAVFCGLRLNEFSDLVDNINTFIKYPESRKEDFESIKKYLDNIDDKYKVLDTKKLMFMRCGKDYVEQITQQKKAFRLNVIFSNPVIEGNGMLFEVDNVPVFLNINLLTRDSDYQEKCQKYGFDFLEGNFIIADGTNYKFSRKNLLGVYKNGKKLEEA